MSSSRNSNPNNSRATYDASTYLDAHYTTPTAQNRTASRAVQHRANEGRESFKRGHKVVLPATPRSSTPLSPHHEDVTASSRRKDRRLGNNQKSADAKKVYNQLLRKDAKKTMNSESRRHTLLQRTLEQATEQTNQAKRERDRARRESSFGGSSSGATFRWLAGQSSWRRRSWIHVQKLSCWRICWLYLLSGFTLFRDC